MKKIPDPLRRTGIFDLQTPIDLLRKMEADYQRLANAPVDTYAAFDFFVTAAHLPEWLSRMKCAPGEVKDSNAKALCDICDHLANGAKHFETNPDWHHAVDATFVRPPSIPGEWVAGVSYVGDPTGDPIVNLAEKEQAALGRTTISALELAELVLDYWKGHPQIARATALLQRTDSA